MEASLRHGVNASLFPSATAPGLLALTYDHQLRVPGCQTCPRPPVPPPLPLRPPCPPSPPCTLLLPLLVPPLVLVLVLARLCRVAGSAPPLLAWQHSMPKSDRYHTQNAT